MLPEFGWVASKGLKNVAHLQQVTECKAFMDTCIMPGGSLCRHHLLNMSFRIMSYSIMSYSWAVH